MHGSRRSYRAQVTINNSSERLNRALGLIARPSGNARSSRVGCNSSEESVNDRATGRACSQFIPSSTRGDGEETRPKSTEFAAKYSNFVVVSFFFFWRNNINTYNIYTNVELFRDKLELSVWKFSITSLLTKVARCRNWSNVDSHRVIDRLYHYRQSWVENVTG